MTLDLGGDRCVINLFAPSFVACFAACFQVLGHGDLVLHAFHAVDVFGVFGGQVFLGLAGGHAFQCHNAIFHIHLGLGAADVTMIQQFRFDFHADPRIRILSGRSPLSSIRLSTVVTPGNASRHPGPSVCGFVIHVARQGDGSVLGTDLDVLVLQILL